MSEKKIHLASTAPYWENLREQGIQEDKRNEGYVWTIQIKQTNSINAVFANVDYTLDLNCSHVGKDMYGIYRGELAFKFEGDISGVKTILMLLGVGSDEDVNGWFRNDKFVMQLKPYDQSAVDDFVVSFDPSYNPVKEEKETDKYCKELL